MLKRVLPYALLASLVVVGVTLFGVVAREAPSHCPSPMLQHGAHCCAPGQTWTGSACSGTPQRCPEPLRVQLAPPGCAIPPRRVLIAGGSVTIGPSDWESEGRVGQKQINVESFLLDRAEVTVERWAQCVARGSCEPNKAGGALGEPLRSVTAKQAQQFCAAEGGRLPSAEQWIYAAAGKDGRRYPWGNTGLVCRRASYGLEQGPCAEGAKGPLLAGLHRDGATPEGVFDMAGNLAEWVEEAPGEFAAYGGSYRSKLAGQLKSWSREAVVGASPTVGFRCVYAP